MIPHDKNVYLCKLALVTGDRGQVTFEKLVLVFFFKKIIWIVFGIGATIHTRRETECLPHVGLDVKGQTIP